MSNIETLSAGSAEFEEAYGEPISRALDLSTWRVGANMEEIYSRIGDEQISETLRFEAGNKPLIRAHVFSAIHERRAAPPGAGVYQATPQQIERTHKGILFTGAVEAAKGTHFAHETVSIAVNQLGVCTISYRGDQGTYLHRLFRRDLRAGTPGDLDVMLELLDRRMKRASTGAPDERDMLSNLARRGIMAYAERAVLLEKSEAPWRMGDGNPAPMELLTGLGSMELLDRSLEMLHQLLLGHKRWVFVPVASKDLLLLTIGQALNPLEYAIVETAQVSMRRIADAGSYERRYERKLREFVAEVGPRIVRGVYRVSCMGPPYVFYAHAEYAHEAALIALADSAMHEHRGFPMLIDLAGRICAGTFGMQALAAQLEVAYAMQGVSFEYAPGG
ncbi:MAG TPA: hypothetical protein VJ183_10125 [Chloroflexia bacterium]|nr:hypothetical protein [Chloroflexia bacterium]